MAGKIVKDDKTENYEKHLAYDLKGHNIIKIQRVAQKNINGNNYYLIMMEKAILGDLGKFSDFFHNHCLPSLIINPFNELVGDNLLRFYCKQIINALEILDRCNYVHLDLKPENLLISIDLVIKLSDFSLLKKIKDIEKTKIPIRTNGYKSLDYYKNKGNISAKEARKQDYFSLGETLYFLKYGKQMLNFQKFNDKESYMISMVDQLEKEIISINNGIFTDKDFVNFIKDLISYETKDIPNFEQIYRNKWLNKNIEKLSQILLLYDHDEREKILIELQKYDYVIELMMIM